MNSFANGEGRGPQNDSTTRIDYGCFTIQRQHSARTWVFHSRSCTFLGSTVSVRALPTGVLCTAMCFGERFVSLDI